MTNTTLPRITGAAPAGLLLAPQGRIGADPARGTSWADARPAAHAPAPHAPAPHAPAAEGAPVDDAVWQALERMLAERERSRRAHPARGTQR